jgi:hypothetical protein
MIANHMVRYYLDSDNRANWMVGGVPAFGIGANWMVGGFPAFGIGANWMVGSVPAFGIGTDA